MLAPGICIGIQRSVDKNLAYRGFTLFMSFHEEKLYVPKSRSVMRPKFVKTMMLAVRKETSER